MARRSTTTKPKPRSAGDAKVAAGGKGATSKPGRARRGGRTFGGTGFSRGDAKGKHLVIVESPAKAKTINKYLGKDYIVLASVGHVRDLPDKNPKGVKSPVPGVDLEKKFKPTYQVLEGKDKVVSELKAAAKEASDVWFATDLDREGEAIAWHLAQEIGIEPGVAKRVMFPAITKGEIERAFQHPHAIDIDRVNAQQARRIVDRIVGYQVSPLLWKKVARGLSAGRVQSVAVRLVVEREREIRAFVPDEYWEIHANFAMSEAEARTLGPIWREFMARRDEKNHGPTLKAQAAWLGEHKAFCAELVEIDGVKFEIGSAAAGTKGKAGDASWPDLTQRVRAVAEAAGLRNIKVGVREEPEARGPARFVRTITGEADPAVPYRVSSIETKRTTSRPSAPFITSTMQQAASTRLGFGAQRTMRAAQQLYEGVEIPGEGPVGLITYMRTDSTHLSGEALDMARSYVKRAFGDKYLPDKPNFFSSSNKDAQEAHEAIRPTNVDLTPQKVARALSPDQLKLYTLVWERFVACQMAAAEWDSTTVLIRGGSGGTLTFKTTGRVLVFDGFYKVTGVPSSDEQTLPKLAEKQDVRALAIEPEQKFTSPPARYTEASLIRTLESEGIGRPSTYASIIGVIQDRKYVEQLERRFHATDLGEVVTDKLIEAFPRIMDVGYTREMETQLDKIEEDHLDWVDMLSRFYGPFKEALAHAEENLTHAKAETTPAPYDCAKCGAKTVYRFGRNGRFLSCSRYPDCEYASPVDRQGRPRVAEYVDVRCPKTGRPMVRRTGRFGPFLATALQQGEPSDVGMILNIDKKGHVTAPSVPPVLVDESIAVCPKCESALNLRNGIRGPWLGCSRFPKCRGRGKWTDLDEKVRTALEKTLATHELAHPMPIIARLDGTPLTDTSGKPLKDAPTVDALVLQEEPAWEPAPV